MRLGTRGSALALAQANTVAAAIKALGEQVEVVVITTSGDERPGGPAPELNDKARFVKEIEVALIAGDIDLAVHSAKDVPAELAEGLAIAAVPARADARDALCGAESIDGLPEGARVGTASLRRRAQLLATRPDLDVVELRGNVDTRLRKLADGEADAIVLATAGLARLDRAGEGTPIDAAAMTPAAGQGCLALEARADDEATFELAGQLTRSDALITLTAERACVAALGADCKSAVGAHASFDGDLLVLEAFAGAPDGSHWVRDRAEGNQYDPAALGRTVAERMLAAGAGELI